MSDTMGSGDALSGAQAQINAQKAATLAAISKGGQTAADAYAAAQSGNTAAKTAALNAQLGQLGNAPAQFTGAQQATLAAPYDNAAANLTQMGQARQDFMSNLGASSGNYFDQSSAAIPALRAAAHQSLLNSNSKLAQAAITANTNLQLKNIELQIAEANLAKANPANQTPGQWVTAQGGQAGAGATVFGAGQAQNTADQAAQAAAMQNITPNPMGFGAAGVSAALPTVDTSNPGGVSGYTTNPNGSTTPINVQPSAADAAQATQTLNRLLAQLGASGAPGVVPGETINPAGGSGGIPNISPALASQLYDASSGGKADAAALAAAEKAPTSTAAVDTLRNSPQYKEAAPRYTQALSTVGQKGGPPSVAAVDNQLIATYGPDIARQVMADFGRATSTFQAPLPAGG